MEIRLLIEPVFENQTVSSKIARRLRRLFRRPSRSSLPIQGKGFKYGVKIKNIGDTALDGAVIRNIRINSASQAIRFFHETSREFSIEHLNPQDEVTLMFEEISSDLNGTSWISLDVLPRQVETVVTTYQKIGDVTIHEYSVKNAWAVSFTIDSKFEASQEKTNLLILVLTILTFVDGVWGLKEAMLFLLSIIKNVLLLLLSVVNFIP